MNLRDASKYEILYDLPEGEYSREEIGAIKTRTVRGGDSLEIEAFPILHIGRPAMEERRKRESSTAQQLLNIHNAEKRMRRLTEANFCHEDYVLHPTFDYGIIDHGMINKSEMRRALEDAGYPSDEYEARKHMQNYIKRLKRRVKQKGGDPKALKYIYVIEATRMPRPDDPDPLPPRYHYHMLVSSAGVLTAEDLKELWPHGRSKPEHLDFRFNGLEALSKYITKQRRGQRKWTSSKNLVQPQEMLSARKISKTRAAQIARDVQHSGREILEALYPGYSLEWCEVKYSNFIAGAYIYARMRRRR